MTCRADAGDAHRRLVGIGLEVGDQPFQVIRRQALLADDQKRLAADLNDRLQVLQQIELKRVEAAGQHMRGRGADAQRIAVGGRTHGAADADAAGGARDVLDDDGLTEHSPHLLGQEASQGVGCATCRERHDHGHRPRRIALRSGKTGRSQTQYRRDQSRQQFAHGFLHGIGIQRQFADISASVQIFSRQPNPGPIVLLQACRGSYSQATLSHRRPVNREPPCNGGWQRFWQQMWLATAA